MKQRGSALTPRGVEETVQGMLDQTREVRRATLDGAVAADAQHGAAERSFAHLDGADGAETVSAHVLFAHAYALELARAVRGAERFSPSQGRAARSAALPPSVR
ncbi:hypothetical protein GCM10027033_15660 [Leucobacter ruminantium]